MWLEEPYKSFSEKEDVKMRKVIPVAAGRLALHFGHSEQFELIDIDQS